MNWQICVRGKAKRQLKKLPRDYIEHVERVIDEMEINPYGGDVQKMDGADNVWRRRVGSYRVKFEVYENEKLVYIFSIERRTSSTY